MAHQFWFSTSLVGAASTSKTAQTDEEKQRERQRNERELQNALNEAQLIKKERDAKEARQLDFEIKRQQGREAKQQFRQRREQERREQSKESADGTITEHPTELVSKETESGAATQKASAAGQQQGVTSTTATTTAGTTATATATDGQQQLGTSRKHKLQIIQSLRQESSTESDSQSYSEFRGCRAPIASIDNMEELSGRSISLGSTNMALPLRQCSNMTPGLRYRNLGKSGLRASNVGLQFQSMAEDPAEASAVVRLAIESGINLFEVGDFQGEVELGRILKKGNWKRTSYIVTTKIFWSTKSDEKGLSRKYIIEAVKASLQRLQLNYIDVVIIHRMDPMCPCEEICRAMNYVISQGWAMYWGSSRWSAVEIMEAYSNCRQFNCITPIVEQTEYHMFNRDKAELYLPELYNKIGVGLMAWSPGLMETQSNGDRFAISKGSFTKKSQSYSSWTEDEGNKEGWSKEDGPTPGDKIKEISLLAKKLGCTPTQLSIAWTLKHEPVHCLLLSATNPDVLHQNLQALQLLPRLSAAVMLELERILENKPVRPPMISTLMMR